MELNKVSIKERIKNFKVISETKLNSDINRSQGIIYSPEVYESLINLNTHNYGDIKLYQHRPGFPITMMENVVINLYNAHRLYDPIDFNPSLHINISLLIFDGDNALDDNNLYYLGLRGEYIINALLDVHHQTIEETYNSELSILKVTLKLH